MKKQVKDIVKLTQDIDALLHTIDAIARNHSSKHGLPFSTMGYQPFRHQVREFLKTQNKKS